MQMIVGLNNEKQKHIYTYNITYSYIPYATLYIHWYEQPHIFLIWIAIYINYVNTVGPQLSEHLCATSMWKVFR